MQMSQLRHATNTGVCKLRSQIRLTVIGASLFGPLFQTLETGLAATVSASVNSREPTLRRQRIYPRGIKHEIRLLDGLHYRTGLCRDANGCAGGQQGHL